MSFGMTGVFEKVLLTNEDKQKLNSVVDAYDDINKKLNVEIRSHIHGIEVSYQLKGCFYRNEDDKCLGDLRFINPTIYLKSLDGSHSDVSVMVTPLDKPLAYKFFMIRSVEGKDARSLEYDWVITFREGGTQQYSNHDILDTFQYLDSNLENVQGHNGMKVNKKALDILKADKLKVEGIIKGVFDGNLSICQELKSATSYHQIAVCNDVVKQEDPDYFLEFLTCLEIFNLATDAGYCNESTHEEL